MGDGGRDIWAVRFLQDGVGVGGKGGGDRERQMFKFCVVKADP